MEFPDMALRTPPIRLGLLLLGLMAGCVGLSATARADSCPEDLKRLTERWQGEMAKLNAMVAAAKGKPMDPQVFCNQSRPFVAADNALIAYMEKNKDWCGVPDEVITARKADHVKSVAMSSKACTVAAQMKKQQEAGGNGAPQAQALPTGPL
jgi:hypothetical protein